MTATMTPIAPARTLAHDEAGSGPPLVLLHAFPLDRGMWRRQVHPLADRHRVIVPDLFGFGESPLADGGWTVDSMADAVASFLDGIGATDPVVLGGISMGGYVALAFARRHPERLRGLILADTKAEADTEEGKKGRDEMIAFARSNPPTAVIEKMLPKLLGESTRWRHPAIVEEVKRIGARQSVEGLTAALAALRDRPDATPGLGGIRVPTLVLVGSEDGVTPPEVARKLASAISRARFEEIPESGHLSNLEAPDDFLEAVHTFLASV